jgi:hypothetical protein
VSLPMIERGARPSVASMGMLLILVEGTDDVAIGAGSAGLLASLGVTRLAVLQDGDGLALVLEGWAFDPARLADSALEIVAQGGRKNRSLHQVAEVSVAAVRETMKGGSSCKIDGGFWGSSRVSR